MDGIIGNVDELSKSLNGYVNRMIHIRSLSSPEVHGITNAEVYSTLLLENFKNIGTLAEKNRDMIREIIDPILNSRDPLDQEVIDLIESLNDQLLNATDVENIDLPLASLLTDRLLQDADEKGDIDYRISMLDKEMENSYLLINMI
jgi:RNA processing factor Prp31